MSVCTGGGAPGSGTPSFGGVCDGKGTCGSSQCYLPRTDQWVAWASPAESAVPTRIRPPQTRHMSATRVSQCVPLPVSGGVYCATTMACSSGPGLPGQPGLLRYAAGCQLPLPEWHLCGGPHPLQYHAPLRSGSSFWCGGCGRDPLVGPPVSPRWTVSRDGSTFVASFSPTYPACPPSSPGAALAFCPATPREASRSAVHRG